MIHTSPAKYDFRDLGIRVLKACTTRLINWKFKNLSAPYWRIYWHQGKGAFIKTSRRTYALEKESIYIIPPNTPFEAWHTKVVTQLFVHFIMSNQFQNDSNDIYRIRMNPTLKKLLVLPPGKEKAFVETCKIHQLVYASLAHIPGELFVESYTCPQVVKAIQCMRRNLSEVLSNNLLAKEVGLHPNSFIRLFKKTTHATPKLFHTMMRIEEACRMLHHTNESLDEIAAQTGFCDRYHFSRIFKKTRGISPAVFRKQMMGMVQ